MERSIAQEPELFTVGLNLNGHVSQRVPLGGDRGDARHDLHVVSDQLQHVLDGEQVHLRGGELLLRKVLGINLQEGLLVGEKIPVLLAHHVAGIGEQGVSTSGDIPANVVRVPVGEHDDVDIFRLNPLSPQVVS